MSNYDCPIISGPQKTLDSNSPCFQAGSENAWTATQNLSMSCQINKNSPSCMNLQEMADKNQGGGNKRYKKLKTYKKSKKYNRYKKYKKSKKYKIINYKKSKKLKKCKKSK